VTAVSYGEDLFLGVLSRFVAGLFLDKVPLVTGFFAALVPLGRFRMAARCAATNAALAHPASSSGSS
jgi:hypothetical protein